MIVGPQDRFGTNERSKFIFFEKKLLVFMGFQGWQQSVKTKRQTCIKFTTKIYTGGVKKFRKK